MDLGYLLNAEIGLKVPPLENGKIPIGFLPPIPITPESIGAESKGASIGIITNHLNALNPHSQYSLSGHTHTPTDIGAEAIGTSVSAIAAHINVPNPHSQYSLINHSHTTGSVGAEPAGSTDSAIATHKNETDPHPNYLNATRLATALNTIAWYPLTLVNGWSGVNAQYSKLSNGLIVMRGLLSKSNKNSGEVISTMPAGYRPAITQRFPTVDATKDSQPFLDINTNGQIIFNNLNPPNNTIGLTLSGIIYVVS